VRTEDGEGPLGDGPADDEEARVFYAGLKLTAGPPLRLIYRPAVEGLEHVPTTGPAIIAGNHLSVSDHLFVPLVVPRRVLYLAKSDYFTEGGPIGRLKAAFFTALGHVPVDRSSARGGHAAIQTAREVLDRGELLGIYPEGTRSPDGRLYRARVGVARLWLESGVPLLPCGVIGTDVVQPPGQRVPRRHPVLVRFGPVLDASVYDGLKRDGLLYRRVADDIMSAIQKLSGQEYVDVYATTVKEDQDQNPA
jgi:1-acyl-sn-glycerol-3-phosphate acyltransferase